MDEVLLPLLTVPLSKSTVPVSTVSFTVLVLLVVTLGSCHADIILCHPQCDCLDAFFDCTSRGLTAFPADFPTWINKLNVSKNEIEFVGPSQLSRLIHLESLFLDGNNLTTLPLVSQTLDSLSQLSLSRNGIRQLEGEALSFYPKLRDLDLSRNQIDAVDNSSFPSDNQLNALNLAGNYLETLDSGSLQHLGSLTEFNLAKNRITTIAKDAFVTLTNLEKLDLSRNKLETMDSLRFQELKKLQVLNLRRNGMGNLSDAAFYGLEKIQQLSLDWNNIALVEKRWLYGLRSLRTFNLSHNHVSGIEDDSWEFMEQIQFLDLSFNQIQVIGRKSLSGLSKLRMLDFRRNQIAEIQQDAFLALDKLESLDLSYNELSWVLEDTVAPFRGLKECHTLNLANNKIHTLHPESLLGIGNLRFLDLSDNPITWLSEKAFFPVLNVNIILSGIHSLVCDCEAHWLHTKLLQQQMSRARHEGGKGWKSNRKAHLQMDTTCAFPLELASKNLMDVSLRDLSCTDRYRKPVFVEEPKTQVFLVEGNGTLVCHLQSPPNIPITVEWKKEQHKLSKELQSSVETTHRIGSDGRIEVVSRLNLVNVSWTDSGRYQCIGKGLGVVYSRKANVTVHIFPSFVKKPANVTVRLGSNVKFECGSKGFPTPEIAFQKDGGEDFPAALERRFHVMPNDDSFFIMEVKPSDQGVYSCSAKNSAGEIRAYATVTVYETPSFRYVLEDQSAIEGSNAILECTPNGSPKPQIVWSKDGVQIGQVLDKRFHLTENGSLLLIKDVKAEDGGVYECLLTNAVGVARSSSVLTILTAASGKFNFDNAAMTIIFIIIAVFCVVGTSAAWVVVIYTTRKKANSVPGNGFEATPLRPHKYDEFDANTSLTRCPKLPAFHVAKVVNGDSGSQSSSGKDSGNGEDFPDSIATTDGEDDLGVRGWTSRKRDLESFSTFGGARASSSSRLSQPRLDLKSECDINMISMMHTGKEFMSYPRRVPIPVVPHHYSHPQVVCHHVDTILPNLIIQQPPESVQDSEEEQFSDSCYKGSGTRSGSISTAV